MNTKNTPIRAVLVMTLDFFANRFGIPAENLTWGIISSCNEEYQTASCPAVLIKGEKNLFIDIINDKISPLINICGCQTQAHAADVVKKDEGYQFLGEEQSVFLTNDRLEKAYHTKIFGSDLSEEAQKLN